MTPIAHAILITWVLSPLIVMLISEVLDRIDRGGLYTTPRRR